MLFRSPRLATPIMIALSGVVVLANLWFAVDPDAWRVEDQHGPVRWTPYSC